MGKEMARAISFLYEISFLWVSFPYKEGFAMVKGVSKQVIVVHSPDKELFDQAIFILKDGAVGQGITEEALLKEAQQAIRNTDKKPKLSYYGPVWACGGAAVTGIIWLVSSFL